MFVQTISLQLPEKIVLPAIHQTFSVEYLSTNDSKIRCQLNQSNQIKLWGAINRRKDCITLLKKCLKKIAEHYLFEEVLKLSSAHGLTFSRVTFKYTKTRWGSCSSDKSISLCCNLLFLPEYLMRHVLLHELCHTKVMSHGVRFWNLLEKLDPECEKHRKELKKASEWVPGWV